MPIATVGIPFSMRETVRGEQVARSATWAILRFLRNLASLICSLLSASSAPVFLATWYPLYFLSYLNISYNIQIY